MDSKDFTHTIFSETEKENIDYFLDENGEPFFPDKPFPENINIDIDLNN